MGQLFGQLTKREVSVRGGGGLMSNSKATVEGNTLRKCRLREIGEERQ